MALGIVVGGIGLASMFGPSGPVSSREAPDQSDQIVLRRRANRVDFAREAGADAASSPATAINFPSFPVFPSLPESAATVREQRAAPLPPALAKSFPSDDLATSARWGTSLGIGLPGAALAAPPRRHKIVNGDSLPALARRYLGSEARADEIFDANRDVLTSPDALPISIELRIPPRDPPQSSGKAHQLVPIAPRNGAR